MRILSIRFKYAKPFCILPAKLAQTVHTSKYISWFFLAFVHLDFLF
ncbi:hypothetical protein HMPREF1254_1405 [Prevotella sp. BV3P1]|nr:hypothetical protein HMPREF1254_1405 [Prevotella sp. BV3P1]